MSETMTAEEEPADMSEALVAAHQKIEELLQLSRQADSRYAAAEDEKHGLLHALEEKDVELRQCQTEYNELGSNFQDLRKGLSKLESELQNYQSRVMVLQFKEQSLEQELEMTKRSFEWTNKELENKSVQFAGYRKDKSALVLSLQSDLEELTAKAESSQSLVENLRARVDNDAMALDFANKEVKELQAKIVVQEESFRTEIATQQRLAKLWEKTAEEARGRIVQLEEQIAFKSQRAALETAQLRKFLEDEKLRADEAEERLGRSEAEKDRLERIIIPQASYVEDADVSINSSYNTLPSSVPKILKSLIAKKDLTELYSENSLLKSSLTHEKHKNEKLQHCLDELIEDLESRAPQLMHERTELKQVREEINRVNELLVTALEQKNQFEQELKKLKTELSDKCRESNLCRQQAKDLGRQIQCLLLQLHEYDTGAIPLTPAEQAALRRLTEAEDEGIDISDTDALISERLIVFRNMQELQVQNQNLLKITRELGSRMEQEEERTRVRLADYEASVLAQSNEIVYKLREEIDSVTQKMNESARERDILRTMVSNGSSPQDYEEKIKLKHDNESLLSQVTQLQSKQDELNEDLCNITSEHQAIICELQDRLRELLAEKEQNALQNDIHMQNTVTKEHYETKMAEWSLKYQELMKKSMKTFDELSRRADAAVNDKEAAIAQQEEKQRKLNAIIADLQSEFQALQTKNNCLQEHLEVEKTHNLDAEPLQIAESNDTLLQEIASLKDQLDVAKTQTGEGKDHYETMISDWHTKYQKLVKQSKEKFAELSKRAKTANVEKENAIAMKDAVQAQLDALKESGIRTEADDQLKIKMEEELIAKLNMKTEKMVEEAEMRSRVKVSQLESQNKKLRSKVQELDNKSNAPVDDNSDTEKQLTNFRDRIVELENDLNAMKENMEKLQSENNRLQLLVNGMVDSKEIQILKDDLATSINREISLSQEIDSLKGHLNNAMSEKGEGKEHYEALISDWSAKYQKLVKQSKEKFAELSRRAKAASIERDDAIAQRDSIQKLLDAMKEADLAKPLDDEVKKQIEEDFVAKFKNKAEKMVAEAEMRSRLKISQLESQNKKLREKYQELEIKVKESDASKTTVEAEQQISTLKNSNAELESRLDSLQTTVETLETEKNRLQALVDNMIDPNELQVLKNVLSVTLNREKLLLQEVETLKEQLNNAINETGEGKGKYETMISDWSTKYQKLVKQSKEKFAELSKRAKAATADKETAFAERDSMQKLLDEIKSNNIIDQSDDKLKTALEEEITAKLKDKTEKLVAEAEMRSRVKIMQLETQNKKLTAKFKELEQHECHSMVSSEEASKSTAHE